MEARDFQITAKIRRVLQRRAVDSSNVEYGSVDGVAYLRGPIRRLPGTPPGDAASRLGSLLVKIEDELGRIDGVHSVVLDIPGFEKVRGEWTETK